MASWMTELWLVPAPTGRLRGDHLCWPFRRPDELVAAARAYVAEGLTRNEQVAYLGEGRQRDLRRQLAGIPGVDDYVDRGQLRVVDARTLPTADPPPEPGRCPYAIKPLPRNVTRAVDRIVADMYPQFRDKLLTTKREDLPQFQDWGKGIRTQLCLEAGGNDQLMRSACKGELCHPDTASTVIMEAVWDRLQSVKKVLRPGQPIPKFAPTSESTRNSEHDLTLRTG